MFQCPMKQGYQRSIISKSQGSLKKATDSGKLNILILIKLQKASIQGRKQGCLTAENAFKSHCHMSDGTAGENLSLRNSRLTNLT